MIKEAKTKEGFNKVMTRKAKTKETKEPKINAAQSSETTVSHDQGTYVQDDKDQGDQGTAAMTNALKTLLVYGILLFTFIMLSEGG